MNFFNHQQIDRVHDGVRDKDSLISGWRNDGNHTIRMIKLNYLKNAMCKTQMLNLFKLTITSYDAHRTDVHSSIEKVN